MKVDVFILAAGLGTRLRPLTDTVPKPLIEVNGKPLIAYHLERLSREGFHRVRINLHYLPEKIREYVGSGSKWGLDVSFSFEPVLLDTGGGVKNVESWLKSDNLLIINSDSVFDESLSLKAFVSKHLASSSSMTLLVGPSDQHFTPLYTDQNTDLVGFGKDFSSTSSTVPVSYLGVMAINRKLMALMPPVGVPFSLTTGIIPGLLSTGEKIRTVAFDKFWSDVGTPERLEQASKYFEKT